MLDKWVDATSKGRTNLPPDKVPWKAIQTLLSQVSSQLDCYWPGVTRYEPIYGDRSSTAARSTPSSTSG